MVQGSENDLKDIRFYTNTSEVDFVTDNEPITDLNDNILTVDGKAVVAKNLATQATTDFVNHQGTGGAEHASVIDATAGFMSAADKTKLDGIQAEAQINILSPVDALELVGGGRTVLHRHISVTTLTDGFMAAADKTKLNGIAAGANVNNVSDTDADLLARSPGVDANALHIHTTPTLVETFTQVEHDALPDHSIFPGVPPSFPGFTTTDLFNVSPTQTQSGQTIFVNQYAFSVDVLTTEIQSIRADNPILFGLIGGWGAGESFTIDDVSLGPGALPGGSAGTVTFSVTRFGGIGNSLGAMAIYQSGFGE